MSVRLLKNDIEIASMETTRAMIMKELEDVERRLPATLKRSPHRYELLERKEMLLRQLREEKLRIKLAKKSLRAGIIGNNLSISDHALIRWLERKHNIDTDELRAVILTEELNAAIEANQWYDDGEFTYVVANRMVITIFPTKERPQEAA